MIPLFKVFMPPASDIDAPLLETLHSGYIAQGKKVDEFDAKFGEMIDNEYCFSVNSGTSALLIALRLAGVQAGDEVVTTPMTCSATNEVILQTGAIPVFADIDPSTGNVTDQTINEAVTTNTKAVMIMDWGGYPCDIDAIREAIPAGMPIIEDAAHALGALYNDGSRVGSGKADFTCFSLQAIKHINTGDGGVVACRSAETYLRGRRLRWFGIDRDIPVKDSRIDQEIIEWGYKAHMNDINATMGLVALQHLDRIVGKYQANSTRLISAINEPVSHAARPLEDSACWLHTLLFPSKEARDQAKVFFDAKGIASNQVHRRNDMYEVFAPYAPHTPLPGVTLFYDRMLCIPTHWGLSSEDVGYIIETTNEFARKFL